MFWNHIFKGVLFPIFENINKLDEKNELLKDDNWIKTTCEKVINSIIELYSKFYFKNLFQDVIKIIEVLGRSDNETLSKLFNNSIFHLIQKNSKKFEDGKYIFYYLIYYL
jgi:hypothetical protein